MDLIYTAVIFVFIFTQIALLALRRADISFIMAAIGLAVTAASYTQSANIPFSPWIQVSLGVVSIYIIGNVVISKVGG